MGGPGTSSPCSFSKETVRSTYSIPGAGFNSFIILMCACGCGYYNEQAEVHANSTQT